MATLLQVYFYNFAQIIPWSQEVFNSPRQILNYQIKSLAIDPRGKLNSFSKQAEKHADFSTIKIWDQSDCWLKSYGQKVKISAKAAFWPYLLSQQSDLSQILSVEKSAYFSACLVNQFHPGVKSQGLYLVKLKFGGES